MKNRKRTLSLIEIVCMIAHNATSQTARTSHELYQIRFLLRQNLLADFVDSATTSPGASVTTSVHIDAVDYPDLV